MALHKLRGALAAVAICASRRFRTIVRRRTPGAERMIVELGHLALILAFLVAIVQMIVPMVGAAPRLGRLDARSPCPRRSCSSR